MHRDGGSVRGDDTFLTPSTVDGAVDRMLQDWAVPKSLRFATGFLQQTRLSGGLWVYPGGTHSRDLLPVLMAQPDLRLRGIVDRGSAEACAAFELPVVSPERLAEHLAEGDQILISHLSYEAELVRSLQDAGVPADCIRPLYTSADYRAYCRNRTRSEVLLAEVLPLARQSRIRHVILRASTTSVLSDRTLAEVFPPDQTLLIGSVKQGIPVRSDVFPVLDLCGQLALIPDLLAELRPETVYFQATFDGFFQYSLIRRADVPLELIFEFWDSWLIGLDYLSLPELVDYFGLSEEFIRLSHSAEALLLQDASLVVSKRSSGWPAVLRQPHAPVAEYFVGIEDVGVPRCEAGDAAGPGALKRIAFASSMVVPERLDRFPGLRVNHEHLPLLAALSRSGAARITLFNGSDTGQSDSPFAGFAMDVKAAGIAYRTRQPLEVLRQSLTDFDYGWVRAAGNVRTRDHDVVIPATFSSYASVGLPVIIHDCLVHAAALVRRFDAGIVVSGERSAEEIVALVRAGDSRRHREGAARMLDWMQSHNRTTTTALRVRFGVAPNLCEQP